MNETKWTPGDLREQARRTSMDACKKLFAPNMLVQWVQVEARYGGIQDMGAEEVTYRGRVNRVGDVCEIRLSNGDYRYIHVLDLRVVYG